MEIENSISGEIPSRGTKEKKKKKHKDPEANPNLEQQPVADVASEKESRKRKIKKTSGTLEGSSLLSYHGDDIVTKAIKERQKKVDESNTVAGKRTGQGGRDKRPEDKESFEREADLTLGKKREVTRRSDDVVSGNKQKKKKEKEKTQRSDIVEAKPNVDDQSLGLETNVNFEKKKKKKKKKKKQALRNDNDTEDASRKEIIDSEPLVVNSPSRKKKKGSSLVLAEAEDFMSLENGVDVDLGTEEMKREKSVDRTMSAMISLSLVSHDSTRTSDTMTLKRKKKKKKRIDQEENQNNDASLDMEAENSEKPSQIEEDLSCDEEKKRKKMKKNKVQESLEATVTENVEASEKSSFGVIEGEPVRREFVLPEPRFDLESGKTKTYERKRIRKDLSEVKDFSVSGAPNLIDKVGPETVLLTQRRKKLLILDVNGILVDFVSLVPNPEEHKADIEISRKHVFKRPYCDEFIQFCLKNFTVAVWSSRMKWNVDLVISFLFGDLKKELLFIWDQSHCTMTRFKTLDNFRKPLVLKELRKVWDKFENEHYDETNTLLLDDSPYKALRNPANTAIFPKSYVYTDKDDNSLGTGGALRTYLEALFLADNVQKYVQQNPFGQQAISESHRSWDFYKRIVYGNIDRRF